MEPATKRPEGPRVALVLAVLALIGYLVAVVLFVLPVESRVQDCGAPGAYLLSGRIDVVPDDQDRIVRDGQLVTLDADVADAVRRSSCADRIAARAVPGGIALLFGFVVGLAALFTQMFSLLWHRDRPVADPTVADTPIADTPVPDAPVATDPWAEGGGTPPPASPPRPGSDPA